MENGYRKLLADVLHYHSLAPKTLALKMLKKKKNTNTN